jgi:hypothetical protein
METKKLENQKIKNIPEQVLQVIINALWHLFLGKKKASGWLVAFVIILCCIPLCARFPAVQYVPSVPWGHLLNSVQCQANPNPSSSPHSQGQRGNQQDNTL